MGMNPLAAPLLPPTESPGQKQDRIPGVTKTGFTTGSFDYANVSGQDTPSQGENCRTGTALQLFPCKWSSSVNTAEAAGLRDMGPGCEDCGAEARLEPDTRSRCLFQGRYAE